MSLLIAALTMGLIFAVLAFGVYVTFRIFNTPDITAEGSITLGGAVAAAMIVGGADPVTATAAAVLAGALAGTTTGVMAMKFGVQPLLAGILSTTGLYSINLRVMGRSNLPVEDHATLAALAERAFAPLFGMRATVDLAGWSVGSRDLAMLLAVGMLVVVVGATLYWFLRTEAGATMRATGDNPKMMGALGVSVPTLTIVGLAMSNGLIALCGALLMQYQGFADVQMGIGTIVFGLASVIIGEALVGGRSLGLLICGAVMGSLLFRLLVALALRWGLDPNDLKLITAGFVLVALVAPGLLRRLDARVAPRAKGA